MSSRTLLTLPLLLLSLLCLPASAQDSPAAGFTLRTVVIDAGHGGRDPGAVHGKLREKDVTLDIAVRLGEKIKKAYPDVRVIYTRDRDFYVTLAERGRIANRNHADLFISIHANSVRNSSARGTETYLMGLDESKSNLEVSKRENAVILLEEDYTTTYAGYDPNEPDSFIFFNMMQNAQLEQSLKMADLVEQALSRGPVAHSRGVKQAALLVLWRTTMPAILVEVGFLSNASDREHLSSREGRGRIADCLFEAFKAFKADYDRVPEPVPAPAETPAAPKPTAPVAPATPATPTAPAPAAAPAVSATDTLYRIQVFSLSRKLESGAPEFLGEAVDCLAVGDSYKYCIGFYRNRFEAAQALPGYKRKFPGAFLIRVAPDGSVVR